MPHIVADRVLETSTTTGTGALTLAGAVTGFRAFSAVCATNDTVPYYIEAVDGSGVPTGEWETGFGTYSAASTLTRTAVVASSNAGAAVTFSAGTKRVGIGALGSVKVDIQIFTSAGTWTKPTWASEIEVIAIGGGGGGGAGRKGAAGTNRTGGGAGGGAGGTKQKFRAADLPSSVSVTVGAAGVGAPAQTANSTDGAAGTAGGTSSFGTYAYAAGGLGGSAGIGAANNASVSGGRGDSGIGGSGFLSQNGSASAANIGTGFAAPGGAPGGGITSANAVTNGGQGWNTTRGTAPSFISGGNTSPTASSVTGAGASGTDLDTTRWLPGESGDGGAASRTGNAFAGGKGGKWGGGGGGGGAGEDSVGNSGAGGNGGQGLVVVISRP